MTRIVGKNSLTGIFLWVSLTATGPAFADSKQPDSRITPADSRFTSASSSGNTGNSIDNSKKCVFDKHTRLTWELKSNDKGVQDARQTYSWYVPEKNRNGGFPGYRNRGKCVLALCDTQAYIDEINKQKLCGRTDWRLPTREELRSIVDYSIVYPGPSVNRQLFPNTEGQFYWSATPDANDSDSAWGIGFSFGYDYAYFKSDHGYIRLVSGPK